LGCSSKLVGLGEDLVGLFDGAAHKNRHRS